MSVAEQEAKQSALPTPMEEPKVEEWLTDVVDQWKRSAFRRSLDRRHAAVPYDVVVEAARVVRTTPS